MDGMHAGHMPGMEGMAPAPMNRTTVGMMGGMRRHKMMMHMTFYWGKNALILFTGWPGKNSGMYALSLLFVFFLAILVEWLTHSKLIKDGSNNVAAGLIRTLIHMIRVGLAYMLMLAVMSFNACVFLVAVAGHAVGFMLFGSRVFSNSPAVAGKTSDSSPMSC